MEMVGSFAKDRGRNFLVGLVQQIDLYTPFPKRKTLYTRWLVAVTCISACLGQGYDAHLLT